jgi:hypothetical protein
MFVYLRRQCEGVIVACRQSITHSRPRNEVDKTDQQILRSRHFILGKRALVTGQTDKGLDGKR